MNNSLLRLDANSLPPFNEIKAEHFLPAIKQLLQENRAQLQKRLAQNTLPTWENFFQPMEDEASRLNYVWSTINHLNAVVNNETIRQAYNECLPLMTEYGTEIAHNQQLFQRIKTFKDSPDFMQLNPIQQRIINNNLRDFHLAGVDLDVQAKQRFKELQQRLSELTNKFEENVLDATQGWSRLVTDEKELSGIPGYAVASTKELAKYQQVSGWLFNLELPSYIAIMTYADSDALREEMYHAYTTRASEIGPTAKRWDNSKVLYEILNVRFEIAKLLGFNNFAELSLATKTAKNTTEVIDFLEGLAQKALPNARCEYAELGKFAKERYGNEELRPWDVAYYSEKLRRHRFSIADEMLRPYFPASQVLDGMFAIVNRLFGINIEELHGIATWHEDVRVFAVYDKDGKQRGYFYVDLYSRQNKRGGAWMEEGRSRQQLQNQSIQLPVVYLNCNFARPVDNKPALLTHDEVVTLLHEFGHGLQGFLTQINYAPVAGTNGVPWDCVEFPSQFMENWAWEKAALDLMTKHYETAETLPEHLYKQLRATKNFQSSMQMVRQLEFSLFDFKLHRDFDPTQHDQAQQILNAVRQALCVYKVPEFNRFQNSFTHIFGSSYAAGYYSYKWAEVLSSDAFAEFEEKGIFDAATGQLFLKTILEKGGSEDPIKLFIDFRGREPKIDALLKHMERCSSDGMEGQELHNSSHQ